MFDENSIENGIFIYFLGKLLLEDRTIRKNIIFLQQFLSGSGVVEPP